MLASGSIFDLPDPFDDGFGQSPAPRAPAIPRLTPQEEEGLLSTIGSGALHGLGWIGGSLDKAFGGRAIRGLLGGRPEELLSVLPWSDTLGITDPAKSVSGSELLGNKDADFLSPEGIGGLGLEMLLDPSTYLTFGAGAAATQLGKTATKAGIKVPTSVAVKGLKAGSMEADNLARAASKFTAQGPVTPGMLADVVDKPLGGHVGIGLPFMQPAKVFDLTNQLDAVGNFANKIPGSGVVKRIGDPLRRSFAQLFDGSVKEQFLPEAQAAARWASQETPVAQAGARSAYADWLKDVWKKAGWQEGMEKTPEIMARLDEQGQMLNDIIERIPHESWDEFARLPAKEAAELEGLVQRAGPGADELLKLYGITPKALPGPLSEAATRDMIPFGNVGGPLDKPVQRIYFTPADEMRLYDLLGQQSQRQSAAAAAREFLAKADPDLVNLGYGYRRLDNELLNAANQLGHADLPLSDPVVQHLRRNASLVRDTKGTSKSALKPESQGERLSMFRTLFKNKINEIARDDVLRAMPEDQAAKFLQENYLGFDKASRIEHKQLLDKAIGSMTAAERDEFFDFFGGRTVADTQDKMNRFAELYTKAGKSSSMADMKRLKELNDIVEQSKELASWQKALEPEALKKAGGYFGNHPAADFETYLANETARQINTKGIYKAAGQMGKQPGGHIPLNQVLEKLRLTRPEAKMRLAEEMTGGVVDPAVVDQIVGGLKFTPEQAEAMTQFVKPANPPPGAGPFLSVMDSILNITKAGQTSWPATQMRNIISDVAKRFFGGGDPFTPLSYAKLAREGQTIPGIAQRVERFAGMTDEQATQQLLKEIYQQNLTSSMKYQATEFAGMDPAFELLKREMPEVGLPKRGLMDSMRATLPGLEDLSLEKLKSGNSRLDPLNLRGSALNWDGSIGKPRGESGFTVGAAAQASQSYMEELNRIATYIDASMRGYNPTAANRATDWAHYNFSDMTRFEKEWMRRIFPFYSWLRQSIPNTVGEIAANPGGRMAQTMRTMNAASGEQGFFPEDLASTGYAIPVSGQISPSATVNSIAYRVYKAVPPASPG